MQKFFSLISTRQLVMLAIAATAACFGYLEAAGPVLMGAVAISADNPGVYGAGAYPDRTGIFIPELWSGKLLEKFYASTVFGMISNTDY